MDRDRSGRDDWSDDDRSAARIAHDSRAQSDPDPDPGQTITLSDVAKTMAGGCTTTPGNPEEVFISYEYEPRPGSAR